MNHTITIDDISFQLKKAHDFKWLKDLGRVFAVFDQQDSGNLCFGVDTGESQIFVKYAGAATTRYEGETADAVRRLESGLHLYRDLQHSHLVKLVDHYAVNNGYVSIFEWFNGECLHSHWAFAGWDKYHRPDSPYFRYKNLPLKKRLISLDTIFSFHQFVESKGYIAIDFYDGSILYDFKNDVTQICDIDYYRRRPTFNEVGENFWGSKRFKSPEEYEFNAPIDERTNVYNMGAVAFVLLGGELDRTFDKWEAGEALYSVALRAVERDRKNRYDSVRQFYKAWKSETSTPTNILSAETGGDKHLPYE